MTVEAFSAGTADLCLLLMHCTFGDRALAPPSSQRSLTMSGKATLIQSISLEDASIQDLTRACSVILELLRHNALAFRSGVREGVYRSLVLQAPSPQAPVLW